MWRISSKMSRYNFFKKNGFSCCIYKHIQVRSRVAVMTCYERLKVTGCVHFEFDDQVEVG